MVDFNEVSSRTDGGEAIDRIAEEFGISKEEANAAVGALMPGIAAGVRAKASDPATFLALLGVHGPGQPLAALGDSASLPIPDAERDAIVAKAAAATGLAPSLLSKMLPVIGSLVVSAIVKAIQSRGVGGILSDLAKVAGAGGLGSILGQVLGGGRAEASPVPPQGSPSGSGGGIDLGSILEQVLRGGQGQASPVPPQGSPSGSGGGIDLGSILEQVLRGGQGQASSPPPGAPERPRGGLEEEVGKILRGTRD